MPEVGPRPTKLACTYLISIDELGTAKLAVAPKRSYGDTSNCKKIFSAGPDISPMPEVGPRPTKLACTYLISIDELGTAKLAVAPKRSYGDKSNCKKIFSAGTDISQMHEVGSRTTKLACTYRSAGHTYA